jgi:hypothetical protein
MKGIDLELMPPILITDGIAKRSSSSVTIMHPSEVERHYIASFLKALHCDDQIYPAPCRQNDKEPLHKGKLKKERIVRSQK